MQMLSLNELGSVNRGKSKHRPRNDPALYGGNYPFVQTGDIKHSAFYVTSHSQTYNEIGLAQSKLWDAGTLCITIAANIADTAILTYPACFPDSIIGFIADEKKADTKYVKYCLDIYKKIMLNISLGATQDNMSVSKLLSLKFPIPDLKIQKKIAATVSTYDDLIEVNKKRIQLLENMAEELYKEWFVRFRFPNWENTEFEKGIPTDWMEVNLGDICNIVMGQSPKSEYYNEEGVGLPFHQGVGTYGDRFPINKTYCSIPGRTAYKNDILFSVRAPVGRLNIANTKMIIGRGLSAISSSAGHNDYLYYLLNYSFGKEDTIGNGAIFNSVTKNELLGFKVLYPSKDIVEEFNDLTSHLNSLITTLYDTNEKLLSQKDSLLSRLISGKLSVEDLDIEFPPSMQTEDNNLQ